MVFRSRNIARTVALCAGLWLGATSAAWAQNWIGPEVASDVDADNGCSLAVSGNGRFYRLTATGLEPGERAQLVLFNEDIKPIERSIRVGQDGAWRDFYLPALAHRRLGTVHAYVTGARCELRVSFDWRRPSATRESAPAWAASHFPEE